MKLGLIGNGAIAHFVQQHLEQRGHSIDAMLLRPERVHAQRLNGCSGPVLAAGVAELPEGLDHIIDCAGHEALRDHGADILRAGYDLTTVSIGALADQDLAAALEEAACAGGSTLHLASGAIGALDALRAGTVGGIASVRYIGRKPPKGWIGSPAEQQLDLQNMTGDAQTHFLGSARPGRPPQPTPRTPM